MLLKSKNILPISKRTCRPTNSCDGASDGARLKKQTCKHTWEINKSRELCSEEEIVEKQQVGERVGARKQ